MCARAGTLLALRRLSSERKRNLLLFLCETGLIRKLPNIREESTPVLDLYGADLKEIDLSGCKLPDAVLANTYLSHADLSNTVLRGVDLRGADLEGATLKGADLSAADLSHVKVTDRQLEAAKSLKRDTMPDGSTHP